MTKQEFMEAVSIDIVSALKNTIENMGLVDTGYLKRRIIPSIEGNDIVLTFPIYAKFLEFGTAPHIIRPKDKKALMWKGAKYPVKEVHHPGTRPYAFIRTTFHKKIQGIIERNAKRYLWHTKNQQ